MPFKTALIITLFASLLSSQTYLSGEISGFYPGYDYIVQGTIHVLPGKRAEFAPGSRLFFDQYSGIIVHGSLICEGNKDSLIIFSSINDKSYLDADIKPEPFDWNGIEVKPTSDSLILSYTKMSYSSLGITVASEATNVKLHAVRFFMNGTNNFSINGRVIHFADYVEINYPLQSDNSTILPQDTTNHNPVRTAKKRDKRKTLRTIYSLATGLLAFCGAALWITAEAKAQSYQDMYEKQSTSTTAGQYRDKRDKWVKHRNTGTILCIGGSVTFPINFVFKGKRRTPQVTNN